MVNGDRIFNQEDNVSAIYLGMSTFYTKDYISLDAVESIIRAADSKLDMIIRARKYQQTNQTIQIAMIDIPDRVGTTAIEIEKLLKNYKTIEEAKDETLGTN